MKLVVDANIFISAFLKDSLTRELILDRRLELYSPEFLLEEFKKHYGYLIDKSGLKPCEAAKLSKKLLLRINLVPFSELYPYLQAAKHLTNDEKDERYIACVLAVGADLWSRDKHLKQTRIKCWNTEEIATKLSMTSR